MAILSSFNVLFIRISFLFTISFFCIKNVNSILENSYFDVFSQAMNLPSIQISRYSAQLGLISVLFAFLAFSDLVPLLEDNKTYFQSMVPFRLFFYFLLTGLAYYLDDNYYLHNNVVFIYCFVEIWLNFLIYNSLREEKEKEYEATNKLLKEVEQITEQD